MLKIVILNIRFFEDFKVDEDKSAKISFFAAALKLHNASRANKITSQKERDPVIKISSNFEIFVSSQLSSFYQTTIYFIFAYINYENLV